MRIALAIAAVLALTACDEISVPKTVKASGPDLTEPVTVGTFTGIDLRGAEDVEIRTGGATAVSLQGPREWIDNLDIGVRDGVLRIARKHGNLQFEGRDTKIVVTTPALSTVLVTGAGSISVDKVAGESLSLSLDGAAAIDFGSIDVKTLEMSIRGAGSVEAGGGKVERTTLGIKGVGTFDLGKLVTRDVAVTLKGTGSVDIGATGTATIDSSGVGSVDITGGAKCTVIRKGIGSVDCR